MGALCLVAPIQEVNHDGRFLFVDMVMPGIISRNGTYWEGVLWRPLQRRQSSDPELTLGLRFATAALREDIAPCSLIRFGGNS